MNMSHTTGRMSLLLAGISLVIFLPWTATLAQDAQSEASEEERLRVIAAYDAAVAEGDLTGAVTANPLAPVLILLVVAAWVVYLIGRPALPVTTKTLGRAATVALPGLWLFQLHRYDLI